MTKGFNLLYASSKLINYLGCILAGKLSSIHQAVTPGEAIKMFRELQELSQADLESIAGIAGIAQSNISALENDTRQLGRERALILAKALKVQPAVLFFLDFDMVYLCLIIGVVSVQSFNLSKAYTLQQLQRKFS